MHMLPFNAADTEIKKLVIEWNELLACEKYEEAFAMFPSSNCEFEWTPQLLKKCINTYGVISIDNESLEEMLNKFDVEEFRITSILDRDDKNEIIDNIDVDRIHTFGLNQEQYNGMVYFETVSLSGFLSDLTAIFNIKIIDEDKITLEFEDLHVM